MRLSDKPAWDKLIYGLIYPGFLGSMLYEFVPSSSSDFALSHFLTFNNAIRVLILLFYFLDYLHLYGDMDGLIQNPNKKSVGYFVVDILTCLGYLVAFIALKGPRYWPTFVVFALVPALFWIYKRKNIYDKKFLRPYAGASLMVGIYRLAGSLFPGLILIYDRTLALLFVVFHVVAYGAYVFWFYERDSRGYDRNQLYADKAPVTLPLPIAQPKGI